MTHATMNTMPQAVKAVAVVPLSPTPIPTVHRHLQIRAMAAHLQSLLIELKMMIMQGMHISIISDSNKPTFILRKKQNHIINSSSSNSGMLKKSKKLDFHQMLSMLNRRIRTRRKRIQKKMATQTRVKVIVEAIQIPILQTMKVKPKTKSAKSIEQMQKMEEENTIQQTILRTHPQQQITHPTQHMMKMTPTMKMMMIRRIRKMKTHKRQRRRQRTRLKI